MSGFKNSLKSIFLSVSEVLQSKMYSQTMELNSRYQFDIVQLFDVNNTSFVKVYMLYMLSNNIKVWL